jgi:hypothetical protein
LTIYVSERSNVNQILLSFCSISIVLPILLSKVGSFQLDVLQDRFG